MLVVHVVEAMCPRLDDLRQNLGKWLHEAQETSKHRFLPFPNVANESGRCAPRDESVVATRNSERWQPERYSAGLCRVEDGDGLDQPRRLTVH